MTHVKHLGVSPLCIFTASYPFGSGEGFIRAELEELAKHRTVHVFPRKALRGQVRPLPRNAILHHPAKNYRSPFVILQSVQYFYLFSFIHDFFLSLLLGQPGVRKRVLRSLRALTHHLDAAVVIRRIVASGFSDSSVKYYAFWGDASAVALALWAPHEFMVRFHGGDLYDDRKRGGLPATQARIVSRASHVIAISSHGHSYLCNLYPQHLRKIQLIRLGVPTQPQPITPSSRQRFTFASISHAVPVKRLGLILEGLRILVSRGVDAHWVHVGDGPDLTGLRTRVRELDLEAHVEFVGHLPQAEDGLYPFLRTSSIDAVVNTSSSEGIPVSLMEALSFGIPVIATAVGGSAELVSLSRGRSLPADPSAIEIADTLWEFAHSPTTTRSAAQHAAQKAQREWFNSRIQTQQLLELLKDERS